MEKNINMTRSFPTITIEGSMSQNYRELLMMMKNNRRYTNLHLNGSKGRPYVFRERLESALKTNVPTFRVPIYDPSIGNDGNIQFTSDAQPATGYSPEELEEIAEKNGFRLGTVTEYVLFNATLLYELTRNGYTLDEAWKTLDCAMRSARFDYAELKTVHEKTGCTGVLGVYDLGNTHKIMKGKNGYLVQSHDILHTCVYDHHPSNYNKISVGWFVF